MKRRKNGGDDPIFAAEMAALAEAHARRRPAGDGKIDMGAGEPRLYPCEARKKLGRNSLWPHEITTHYHDVVLPPVSERPKPPPLFPSRFTPSGNAR